MYTSKHTYGKKSITPKAKKLHPFVDLTAMVNLSFLLMMFFMLQSFMKKPNYMDLDMPDGSTCGKDYLICNAGSWRNLTILLGENNKVITYQGLAACPMDKPKVFKSGSKALRNEIFTVNEEVKQQVNDAAKERLHVIIKPSDKCIYENLIATLDEISINKVRSFHINNDLTKEELELLSQK